MELPTSLRVLFPYNVKETKVKGDSSSHESEYTMRYIDEGRPEDEVVILLHGNPTWSFLYRNLIAELKTNFRVIALDHIGLGLSEHPEGVVFRAKERVDHVRQFVETLGIKSFSLVMHDWGGSIGSMLAVGMPERIKRLVYFNTTLTETESLPRIIKQATRPIVGRFITEFTTQFIKLTTRAGVMRPLPPEVVDGYLFPYRSPKQREAIWNFVSDIPFDNTHPSYQHMFELGRKLPLLKDHEVLIMWGLRDPCFHPGMLNHVRRHFPNAQVIEVPEASHLVIEDAPDIVLPRVKEFLTHGKVTSLMNSYSEGEVNPLFKNLLEHVQSIPTHEAIVLAKKSGDKISYSNITFESLISRVHQYRRALTYEGVVPGDKVLILLPPGEEFLSVSYAVMGNGATPIFIDPGVGKENLYKCIADIAPDVVIAVPKVHILRFLKPKLFKSVKLFILGADVPIIFGGKLLGKSLSLMKRFSSTAVESYPTSAPCMIAFTSGATGTPKGVVFTPSMIKHSLEIFKDDMGLLPGGKDLPLLAVFSLFNVAMGRTSVCIPMNPSKPLDVSPELVSEVLDEQKIDSSFGSPTLWKKISEYAIRYNKKFKYLKKVLIAGAPVPKETLILIQDVIPNGTAATPYGATEALPVTWVTASEILNLTPEPATIGGQGTYVGSAARGMKIKIIEPVDGAINDISEVKECSLYSIGEVIVSGGTVSPRYANRPDANRFSKITDGDSFWHRMGDVGYIDNNGGLYFVGRKAHIVKTSSSVFYPIPVERIFNTHENVRRSALISLPTPKQVGVAIECFNHPITDRDKELFLQSLRETSKSNPLTKDIEHFYFFENFPVDGRHNAKIFRDKLSQEAALL